MVHEKKEIHHLRDVLRVTRGERVVIFDEEGNEYQCRVEALRPSVLLSVEVEHPGVQATEHPSITLACAMPKQGKMDEIIEKLTQLGVDRIIPFVSERVIVKLGQERSALRLERWKKVILAAVKQSRRSSFPRIEPISDIKKILSGLSSGEYDLKLMPTLLDTKRRSLKDACLASRPRNIFILIGPEGDFTAGEVELAKKAGCIPVSLGETVLRVDTAAIAVVGFVRLLFS